MDRMRWLVGTRHPVVAGSIVGTFLGIFAFAATALLVTLPHGGDPGNLMPLFALALGGPWGAVVGVGVALVVRRIVRRERLEPPSPP